MATSRQIKANRLNAEKSTGPRTPEGKAVSSQNALKSGLDADSQFVIGESADEFAALQHEYIARFQPLTPEERFHVDTLIRNEWILRRLFRAEAHLWEYHTIRADRSYKDAFAELERLQRARTPLAALQSQPDTPDTPELASFLTPAGGPASRAAQSPALSGGVFR